MAGKKVTKKAKIKIIKNPTGFCQLANKVGDEVDVILLGEDLVKKLISEEYAVQL